MCEWRPNFEAMERRQDEFDARLTRVETTMDETKQIVREGFADIKATMHDAYAEKIAWGDWARHALTDCGKWLGKWGGVIILAALGLSNAKSIAEIIRGWCA